MKYYFIVNPQSGNVKKYNLIEKIKMACEKRQAEYEFLYTERAGHGLELAKGISDEEECVVFSVGGDGNLNEVLNGIVGSKNKILGNIPAGSGNDFAKSIKNYELEIVHTDIGKINDRYFINVACLGLDADVANNLHLVRNKKWIPVSQRYNASLIYTYFKYKFKKIRLLFGGTTIEHDCTILAVCNGQYYGGGYKIGPQAIINDGLLDIYIVEKMAKIKIIPIFLKLIKGKHESSPKVKKYQDGKLIVECEKEEAFNIDGEMITGKRFEIEILKQGIRVYNDMKFLEEIVG